jgi:hypothetical protein
VSTVLFSISRAHVDEELVVVFQRVAGDVHVEHEREQAHADQHGMHRLADRLQESIPRERDERHGEETGVFPSVRCFSIW